MIKSIIFDYDDTLVQTRRTRYKTIRNIGSEIFGSEISENEIDIAWGLPAEQFLIKLFGRFSTNIEFLWSIYIEFSKKDLNIPYPDAFKFIDDNKKIFRIGIVTSSSEKVVLRELSELDINLDAFFKIQTAEHTEVHKPEPQVFVPIFESLVKENISKEEILYIGDSPVDFLSSTKFGFNFLAIAHDNRHITYFEMNNIEFVRNFVELEFKIKEKQNFV